MMALCAAGVTLIVMVVLFLHLRDTSTVYGLVVLENDVGTVCDVVRVPLGMAPVKRRGSIASVLTGMREPFCVRTYVLLREQQEVHEALLEQGGVPADMPGVLYGAQYRVSRDERVWAVRYAQQPEVVVIEGPVEQRGYMIERLSKRIVHELETGAAFLR